MLRESGQQAGNHSLKRENCGDGQERGRIGRLEFEQELAENPCQHQCPDPLSTTPAASRSSVRFKSINVTSHIYWPHSGGICRLGLGAD